MVIQAQPRVMLPDVTQRPNTMLAKDNGVEYMVDLYHWAITVHEKRNGINLNGIVKNFDGTLGFIAELASGKNFSYIPSRSDIMHVLHALEKSFVPSNEDNEIFDESLRYLSQSKSRLEEALANKHYTQSTRNGL